MITKTKVSAVILTKDEGYNLESCIKHIQQHVDEVIVIDSSDDKLAEVISNNLKCGYYKIKLPDYKNNIKGFSDLRNYASCEAANDWILHVDVDEIFNDFLFLELDSIIKQEKSWAYAFPRINLPFYENYPDYQTRLVNKMNTEWINEVHEKLDIFTSPAEVKYLNNYPIIHKERAIQDKLQINNKWLSTRKERNILICSIFKDAEKFINIFLNNLNEMMKYSKIKNYNIELCLIEGNSTDDTAIELKEWLQTISHDITQHYRNINLPSADRFTLLAILRNMAIKLGLKNYHDYVLMIDSDVIFDHTLLERLIVSIETNNCDVIAPLVFIEDFKDYGNEYFYDTLAYLDNNNNNFKHVYPYTPEITTGKDLIKVNSVGTCYLIRANIYNINDFNNFNILKCYTESISKPLMTYEGVNHEDNTPISEQVSFFKKMKRKGHQIYVDTKINILHVNLEKLGLAWH